MFRVRARVIASIAVVAMVVGFVGFGTATTESAPPDRDTETPAVVQSVRPSERIKAPDVRDRLLLVAVLGAAFVAAVLDGARRARVVGTIITPAFAPARTAAPLRGPPALRFA